MRKVLVLSVLCVLVLVACSAPAPPPPPPENAPPPPPTPEEIAAKIRPALQPIEAILAQGKGAGGLSINNEIRNKLIMDIRTAKQQNQSTEEGKQAVKMVSHDIEALIQKARDQERFRVVLGLIAAYEEIEPLGVTMKRLQERALLEVTRPFVAIQGFFDDKDTGETYVFLNVNYVDQKTLEVVPAPKNVRVRKGEEFYDCRLIDFVGDKKGVTLEYLKIPGKIWSVMVQ